MVTVLSSRTLLAWPYGWLRPHASIVISTIKISKDFAAKNGLKYHPIQPICYFYLLNYFIFSLTLNLCNPEGSNFQQVIRRISSSNTAAQNPAVDRTGRAARVNCVPILDVNRARETQSARSIEGFREKVWPLEIWLIAC